VQSVASPAVVAKLPPMVKEPATLPPDVQYQIRRERRRRNQAMFAVALIVMVVALGIALIWVLWRNANSMPAEQKPPVKTGGIYLPQPNQLASMSVPVLVTRSQRT
jgi:hypothetical protein